MRRFTTRSSVGLASTRASRHLAADDYTEIIAFRSQMMWIQAASEIAAEIDIKEIVTRLRHPLTTACLVSRVSLPRNARGNEATVTVTRAPGRGWLVTCANGGGAPDRAVTHWWEPSSVFGLLGRLKAGRIATGEGPSLCLCMCACTCACAISFI